MPALFIRGHALCMLRDVILMCNSLPQKDFDRRQIETPIIFHPRYSHINTFKLQFFTHLFTLYHLVGWDLNQVYWSVKMCCSKLYNGYLWSLIQGSFGVWAQPTRGGVTMQSILSLVQPIPLLTINYSCWFGVWPRVVWDSSHTWSRWRQMLNRSGYKLITVRWRV